MNDHLQCIYLSDDSKCAILNVRKCSTECRFRCSDDKYKASQKHWREQLNSISVEQQNKISRKYYGGKKFW